MAAKSEAKPTHLERAGSRSIPQSLPPRHTSKTSKVTMKSSVQYLNQFDSLQRDMQESPAASATIITTTTQTTTTQISPVWFRSRQSSPPRDPKQYPIANKPIPHDFRSFLEEDRVNGEAYSNNNTSIARIQSTEAILDGDYSLPAPRSIPETHLVRQARRQKKRKSMEDDSESSNTETPEADEDLHRSKKMRPAGDFSTGALSRNPVTPSQRGRRLRGRVEGLQITQDSPVSMTKLAGTASPDHSAQTRSKTATVSTPVYQMQHTTIAVPLSPPSFTEGMVATPPVGDGDVDPLAFSSSSTDASKTQSSTESSVMPNSDPSLPSPVASPITEPSILSDTAPDLDLSLDTVSSQELDHSSSNVNDIFVPGRYELSASHVATHIPSILGYFDSLSETAQKYFIYQMLRRSGTSHLRFIAEHVNPALQCDFLHELPPELSLEIIRYLDVKSLCRAAQVSRKWRELIDTDEKAWRDLLVRDGYNVPLEEVARATREGWEWQGLKPYEKDLGSESDYMRLSTSPTQSISKLITNRGHTIESEGRGKRKYSSKNEHTYKKRKTHNSRSDEVYRSADSPKTLAVDIPEFGLKHFRIPHLFKTIYRRHHCTRGMWMDPDARPQHLAFRAHGRHVVTCLQFDDDKILTGSDDTAIHVYDSNNGALRRTLSGHEGGVWALQYDGNTLVSGSTDRTVRVWDIASGKCLHIFHGHTSTVRCLVILKPSIVGYDGGEPIYMPKQPVIITGSRDTSLRVWRLPGPEDPPESHRRDLTGEDDNKYFVRVLNGHTSSVRAIAAHGDTLVSGSYDSTVRVWKISNGEILHRLTGHTSKVYSVILDHERKRCISGSMDNLVKVWSLETGQCLLNLEGHTSLVGLLDLSHGRLVSAAADSSLRIWDPETGHCKSTLLAHTGAITCFQHDEQKVISGSDRALKLWNVKTGEIVKDLLTDLSGGWQVKFSERKCVAAVQRAGNTYIEILDFGASRDSVANDHLGERIVVNQGGSETEDNISDDDTVDD